MSEQLPIHETPKPVETHEQPVQPVESAEHAPKHHESLHELEQKVEAEARSVVETPIEDSQPASSHNIVIDRLLRAETYDHTLRKIRTHLSKPQRVLSKIVHQPAVEAASEIGSKTVARPSGILGGGIVAFLGSTIIVLLSRKYGFSYNGFMFVLLYAGGFILGMAIELGLYAFRKARRSH